MEAGVERSLQGDSSAPSDTTPAASGSGEVLQRGTGSAGSSTPGLGAPETEVKGGSGGSESAVDDGVGVARDGKDVADKGGLKPDSVQGAAPASSSGGGDAGATGGAPQPGSKQDGDEEGGSSSGKKNGEPASFPKVGQVVNWLVNRVLPRPWK